MKQTFTDIALDKLVASEVNPRSMMRNIEELAESIKASLEAGGPGILQPLAVRKHSKRGHFVILAGHRRAKAAELAGMAAVPCVIQGDSKSDELDAAAHLVENVQRDDLSPWELARGVGQLLAQKIRQKQIAAQVGKSEAWVSKLATIWKAAQMDLKKYPDAVEPKTLHGVEFRNFTNVDHLYTSALFMLNPKPDAQGTIDLVDGADGSTADEISRDPGKDPAEDPNEETPAAGPRDYSVEIDEVISAVAISLALPVDAIGAELDGAGKLHITATFTTLKSAQKVMGLKK